MKLINEFSKLFKVYIPHKDHWRYYVDMLGPVVKAEAELFECMETDIYMFKDPLMNAKTHRLQMLEMLVKHLKATEAYKQIMEWTPTSYTTHTPLCKKLGIIQEDDPVLATRDYVKVDLVQANHNVFRRYDDTIPEWEFMLTDLGVHKCLSLSKYFRQIVYGNVAPKRIHAIHKNTMNYINSLIDEQPIMQTADEIVYHARQRDRIEHVLNQYHKYLPPYRIECFTMEPIPDGYVVTDVKSFGDKKSLHGVPGNRFYMNYKEHILGKPIGPLDKIFKNDGHTAMWID